MSAHMLDPKHRDRLSTIGEILLYMARIDSEDLATALAQQRVNARKLGEELVAEGRVTPDDVSAALDYQARFRAAGTPKDALAVLEELRERARESTAAVCAASR